jgi:transposase
VDHPVVPSTGKRGRTKQSKAKQTLENWVRLHGKGQLKGAGDKPVSPEQMELARLRAELLRVKMERDILKKATAYFAREST